MKMGTTEHTEKNFDPANYDVVAYVDNCRPGWHGQPWEIWSYQIAMWEKNMEGLFGSGWIKKIHRCEHCHNTNVRYIAAVRYIPTGEMIAFGDICVDKLAFRNKDEYEAAKIRAKAKLESEKIRLWNTFCAFVELHPEVEWILEEIEKPVHEKNWFAHDIVKKLKQYGNLSDRQLETVVESLEGAEKAKERAEEAKARAASAQYVGTVGKREEFKVICKKAIRLESTYRYHNELITTLHIMEDASGNPIVWFSKCGKKLDEGEVATIKATVKAHREYTPRNGVATKQTVVNRLSVIEVHDEEDMTPQDFGSELDSLFNI